jgi:hypothetical protein
MCTLSLAYQFLHEVSFFNRGAFWVYAFSHTYLYRRRSHGSPQSQSYFYKVAYWEMWWIDQLLLDMSFGWNPQHGWRSLLGVELWYRFCHVSHEYHSLQVYEFSYFPTYVKINLVLFEGAFKLGSIIKVLNLRKIVKNSEIIVISLISNNLDEWNHVTE